MFFRRSRDESADDANLSGTSGSSAGAGTDTGDGGKGRPTPSRKEAEAARKARVKPVLSAKEQRRRDRAASGTARRSQLAALKAGDEKALPAKDRGPVRSFVRDYVDSRRTIAEYFLFALVVILVGSLTGIPQVQAWANLLWITLLFYVMIEMWWMSRNVKKRVKAEFPNESQKGHGLYAIMRATQYRRFRIPRPRV